MGKSHHGMGLGSVQSSVPQQRKAGTAIVGKAPFTASRTSAEDWRHDAACVYEDPELFFPIGNTGPALLQIEDAKAVCRRCPAIEACLDWALESGMTEGVWGGMSEEERASLKRRAARDRLKAKADAE